MEHLLFLGKSANGPVTMTPRMGNRHGLIAGATGTGKTVTLRVLAEEFSRIGVPVFMADVKGDLAGICHPSADEKTMQERAASIGVEGWEPSKFPVTFWDVFGKSGHPVRTTVSELGPFLLSRLLNLNDTQSGVLTLVFKVADDNGMLLLDLKDLRAMLQYVGENAKDYTLEYGNVSAASIGAIQRGLLQLEEHGGDVFFGEPSLNIADLIQTDTDGRGIINVLAADKLMLSPLIYSTFLLWLLSELFETLPEAGDLAKPKLVFFFDEAHLLFDDASKALLDKIEQVVRLIRSKGVGVYFVSQNALDVSDEVLAQLGNRVQHALRAFTAKDQKALRATAETFRGDGAIDLEEAIGQLAIGEAIVSFLDDRGTPSVAQRVMIAPPRSQLGPISVDERAAIMRASLVAGVYETAVDRESAYEKLKSRAAAAASDDTSQDGSSEPAQQPAQQSASGGTTAASVFSTVMGGTKGSSRGRQGPVEAMVVSAARSVGSQVGRQLFRGILGSLLGKRR